MDAPRSTYDLDFLKRHRKCNAATNLSPESVSSIKYNAAWHYTRDERDNRCWYSINPAYIRNRVYRRGSSVCRWKPGMSRDDSPVKGFPLSNNIVSFTATCPYCISLREHSAWIVPGIVTNANLARFSLLNVK